MRLITFLIIFLMLVGVGFTHDAEEKVNVHL